MPKIRHFLSDSSVERMIHDAAFLTKAVANSQGELYLALRDDYVNVYYRGSSLARIGFTQAGFLVSIHEDYLAGDALESLSKVAEPHPNGHYFDWRVAGHDFHRLLQAAHRVKLQANIKKRNFSEEAMFEQMFIWDNQGRKDFLVIDRQVQPRGHGAKKLDLLALRRVKAGQYRFVAIEAKLGCNRELQGPVFDQLQGYVNAIDEDFEDYRACYMEGVRQQQRMGLLSQTLAGMDIRPGAEGLVVVFAHSGIGEGAIKALVEEHPDIMVQQFRFEIDPSVFGVGGTLV